MQNTVSSTLKGSTGESAAVAWIVCKKIAVLCNACEEEEEEEDCEIDVCDVVCDVFCCSSDCPTSGLAGKSKPLSCSEESTDELVEDSENSSSDESTSESAGKSVFLCIGVFVFMHAVC